MIKKQIKKYGPCEEAVEWLGRRRRVDRAWRECERADWLLWIADRIGIDREKIVLAACDCAETSLVHLPNGEDRPRLAIKAARDWAAGGSATIEQVESAAYAARAATYGTCYAAAYAARAAAYAAHYAANAATNAAASVASVAHDAAKAATNASVAHDVSIVASYAAYAARIKEMCDLVRNHISAADVAERWRKNET